MSSKKILTGPGKLSGVSRNGPQDRESNRGHIGGRRVLSPLRHPCSPEQLEGRYWVRWSARMCKITHSKGNYAGVEACCKICRRHHPSGPQLLFQRLTIVATGGRYEDRKSMFKYEMCTYPPALFDSSLLASQANELALADAIFPIQRPIKQLSLQETSILSLMEVLSCAAWHRHVVLHTMLFAPCMSST